MKLDTVIERMPLWYNAAIRAQELGKDNPVSPYLKSPPGRGKTTTLKRAAGLISKLLNKRIGRVILNGGMLNEMDICGYLVPRHHDNFSDSIYTSPFWWVTDEGKRLEEYDGGIIIVDEEDKCPVEVKKVLGEARLSGRLGPHTLPKGWVVWGAGNRSEDRSGTTKELMHLISRRMEIDIEDDVTSLVTFMTNEGCMPVSISFVESYATLVFAELPEKLGPSCSPRTMVQVDEYLQMLTPAGALPPHDPTIIEEVTGKIGAATAAQFFSHLKLEREMPKFERIVGDPKGCKVPEKADACMLICYKLAHMVSEKTAAPVITYVERLPKDFAVTFATAACRKNHALVNVPAFDKWIMANASLMSAIAFAKN